MAKDQRILLGHHFEDRNCPSDKIQKVGCQLRRTQVDSSSVGAVWIFFLRIKSQSMRLILLGNVFPILAYQIDNRNPST